MVFGLLSVDIETLRRYNASSRNQYESEMVYYIIAFLLEFTCFLRVQFSGQGFIFSRSALTLLHRGTSGGMGVCPRM